MCTTSQVTQAGIPSVRAERPFNFGHGRHAANRRHVAFIPVAKGTPAAGQIPAINCHVVAHLHGRLSYAGNPVAVLLQVGQIAQHENLRQAGG